MHLKRNLSSNISWDCVDFLIIKPTPFTPIRYSHKLNHTGQRYERGFVIYAKIFHGLQFRTALERFQIWRYLDECWNVGQNQRKKLFWDRGYPDVRCDTTDTNLSPQQRVIHRKARARHELMNQSLSNVISWLLSTYMTRVHIT